VLFTVLFFNWMADIDHAAVADVWAPVLGVGSCPRTDTRPTVGDGETVVEFDPLAC
jgi:hypothetical protein